MRSPIKRRILLFALAAGLLLAGSCKEKKQELDPSAREISFTREGELDILQAASDSVLTTLDIEIADTEYETQTGLMYRRDMEDNQAMLFIFEEPGLHSFYMKNTLIPLDLLFVDAQLRIATIQRNARPLDESGISSRVPVQYVLEVKAGLADRWGVTEGDRIRFRRDP